MSELVADCPRCGAQKMTFKLVAAMPTVIEHRWQRWFEAFCLCRHCLRSTIFTLSQKSSKDEHDILSGLENLPAAINQYMNVVGYISIRDQASRQPPEHLPSDVENAFREGAACMSIRCYNAAATMFRLAIDHATRPMLPDDNIDGLNARIRRDLGLRLPWLFDNRYLPEYLRDLSHCIKEDGNDGAHRGNISKEDAMDIVDFTTLVLERLYTEPKKVELAQERRTTRRESTS